MNRLYLLTQTAVRGWDTYDSCVVCAPDREAAKLIHPRGEDYVFDGSQWKLAWATSGFGAAQNWAKPEDVVVIELGAANEALQPGVICASFNSG